MTIQELDRQYFFHDSCITYISFSKDDAVLAIDIDFCNWAQEWYKKGDPELVKLKLTFTGIDNYDGPIGDIDYFGIGNGECKGDSYFLFIEDDFNGSYWDIYLKPTDVDVELLGPVDDNN